MAAAVAPASAAGARETPLAIDELAPQIGLGDQHGRPFTLAAALSQRPFVVVAFYVKAFTGG